MRFIAEILCKKKKKFFLEFVIEKRFIKKFFIYKKAKA